MPELLDELKIFQTSLDAKVAAFGGGLDKITRRMDAIEAEWSRPEGRGGGEVKSFADIVTEHQDFTSLKARGRGRFSIMLGKSFFPDDFEQKTTITSSTVGSSTPGILTPQRHPRIVSPGVTAFRVRDLMPRFTTVQNAVEFVKEDSFTNAASPVAEGISKPESAMAFTISSSGIKTLAHWLPASRQVLDDFGALQGYLNVRLIDGLKDVEDYEIVAGDGTGQHLTGLSTTATAYDTGRNVAGDTKIDKINHGISQIEDVKLRASGIILNPRDWRAIQLTKTEPGGANSGEYIMGGPKGDAVPMLWGLPVATTPAVSVGKFFVGAFATHCAIYDRMEAVIDISTEHDDYFVRNLVAIRCEERLTFLTLRSDAVVYGSF